MEHREWVRNSSTDLDPCDFTVIRKLYGDNKELFPTLDMPLLIKILQSDLNRIPTLDILMKYKEQLETYDKEIFMALDVYLKSPSHCTDRITYTTDEQKFLIRFQNLRMNIGKQLKNLKYPIYKKKSETNILGSLQQLEITLQQELDVQDITDSPELRALLWDIKDKIFSLTLESNNITILRTLIHDMIIVLKQSDNAERKEKITLMKSKVNAKIGKLLVASKK